jgi:hypothetical protein
MANGAMLHCVSALAIRHATPGVTRLPEVFWGADQLCLAESGITDARGTVIVAEAIRVHDRHVEVVVVTINYVSLTSYFSLCQGKAYPG